jgi:hypothetical protein
MESEIAAQNPAAILRISGPKLGRPGKDTVESDKEQAYTDSGVRNTVEGKFGIGKIAYGLNRIMAKLQDTSETMIRLVFFAMNLVNTNLQSKHN